MDNLYFGKLWAVVCLCAMLAAAAASSSPVHAQQTGPGGVPGGNSGGAVSSVFGRTGAVAAATGDYTAAQVTNAATTNTGNTFTASQTVSLGSPRLTLDDTNNASHAVYLYNHLGFETLGSQQSGDGLAVYQVNALVIPNSMVFQWSAGSYLFANGDVGLSRVAPGVLAVGSGGFTVGDSSGWLQSSAIGNGVAGNTDLRGHLTLAGGTATYTFTKVYTVAPTCVAADSTTAASLKVSSSTATLTLTGTGNDVLNYICVD